MISDKTWRYTLVGVFCGVLLYALLNWMEAARSQTNDYKLYRCKLELKINPPPEADIKVYSDGSIIHNGRKILRTKVSKDEISYGFVSRGLLYVTMIDLKTMKMILGTFKPTPLTEVARTPGVCQFLPKV